MEQLLGHLALGFGIALTPANLGLCLIGALVGTLVGVLPGLGPVTTIALLLPITFGMPPEGAMIMLAGIFYGSQYGGSTTSILMNMPGEAASVVTCLDGHAMARQGRAGAALTIAALGSFVGGTLATAAIALAAAPLAAVVRGFTSVDYCALMVFGLVASIILAHGSVLRAVAMIVLGLLLGLVGTDVNSGQQRFAFGVPLLMDGLDFAAVVMGLFGIAEVIATLERHRAGAAASTVARVGRLYLSRAELRQSAPAVLRGTLLGSVLGVLPGSGGMIASFAAYALEKKLAREPGRFGQGAIEGVAAPESANNAGSQTSFIPLLTMGIPGNATMAVLAGAMLIHGIQPGPKVVTEQPSLFWGVIASMWIGNLMLLVINLPLVGVWVKVLDVPYRVMAPAIVLLCCVGVYAVTNSPVALWLMLGFGVVGWLLAKLGFEPAPLVLGFVLGPLLEENFRRAMLISGGDATVFLQRPVSLALLLASAGLLLLVLAPALRRTRAAATAG